MMTTGSFSVPHFEDYSTHFGPATLGHDGQVVTWKFEYGGDTYTGTETIIDGDASAALHRARKAIDALALKVSKGEPVENVQVTKAAGEPEPVAEGPVDPPAADPVV